MTEFSFKHIFGFIFFSELQSFLLCCNPLHFTFNVIGGGIETGFYTQMKSYVL